MFPLHTGRRRPRRLAGIESDRTANPQRKEREERRTRRGLLSASCCSQHSPVSVRVSVPPLHTAGGVLNKLPAERGGPPPPLCTSRHQTEAKVSTVTRTRSTSRFPESPSPLDVVGQKGSSVCRLRPVKCIVIEDFEMKWVQVF